MKKSTKTIIILALIGISFSLALYFFWKINQKEAVVYKTKTAKTQNIVLSTIATGKIIPDEEVSVRSNISGIVDEIFIEPGDEVKVGDVIARIKVVPGVSNLQSSKNAISRAKINLETQEKIYKRQKELFNKGVTSANEYDRATADYEQARQSYLSANENYQIIKTGSAKGYSSTTNTIVKATISGVVLDIPIEVGGQVVTTSNFRNGTSIASIADISKMIFKGQIDESEVGKIREGMPIKITVGAMPDVKFDAKLGHIAPKGFDKNGTVQFNIEARLMLNDTVKLRAGLSANASIILDKATNVLAINEALIQYGKKDKKPFVEVEVGDQQYEKRSVKLGISNGIVSEVVEGITAEDNIKVWNPISAPIKKNKGKKKGKK